MPALNNSRFGGRAILVASLLVCTGGCYGDIGAKQRGHNYSRYLLMFYDDPRLGGNTPRPAILLPAKVAVAELGQLAAPQEMLELRSHPEIFSHVESVPGLFDSIEADELRGGPSADTEDFRRDVRRLHRMARDMGMDYLLVFGGSTHSETRQTSLSILDLTGIGGFVPTQGLRTDVRASAAMIDLRSDRVAPIATADRSSTGVTATFVQDGARRRSEEKLHAQVIPELAKNLIEQLRCVQVGPQPLDITDAAAPIRSDDGSSSSHAAIPPSLTPPLISDRSEPSEPAKVHVSDSVFGP